WRLLAYLLKLSPEVSRVRTVLRKRLMDEARIKASEKSLDRMLLTLAERGFVTLDPPLTLPSPPAGGEGKCEGGADASGSPAASDSPGEPPPGYQVVRAVPTPALDTLLVFRSVHPLYGAFLIEQLGIADRNERIQAMESVLEVPRPLLRYLRVPRPDQL